MLPPPVLAAFMRLLLLGGLPALCLLERQWMLGVWLAWMSRRCLCFTKAGEPSAWERAMGGALL